MNKDFYILPNVCLAVHTDEWLFGVLMDYIEFDDKSTCTLIRLGFMCFSLDFAFLGGK